MLLQIFQCFHVSLSESFLFHLPILSPLRMDLWVIEAHDIFVEEWE